MSNCPRCGDPINETDLHLEIDGNYVHVDCVDEQELGEIAVRLQASLDERDSFIVQRGLWSEFTAGLERALSSDKRDAK